MTKITPKIVDSVTVDHLQDIEIGKTEFFKLPNFRKVKSAQSTASYYGKIKAFGKKFRTQSRLEDNLLIIKAIEL